MVVPLIEERWKEWITDTGFLSSPTVRERHG